MSTPNRLLDDISSKSIVFSLGFVDRVFLNNTDDVKQTQESNSSQMIQVKSLGDNSSMPTIQRILPARPLLRGISDSITRGDLVLFTSIGKKTYYIGPLNTFNNPNVTSADFYNKNLEGRNSVNSSLVNQNGYGNEFPYVENTKIQKTKNYQLDFFTSEQNYESSKLTDLTFEGRHGNSIRIGSRGIFPSITIDNNSLGKKENILKGSTISMIANGSIAQNFGIPEDFFRLSIDVPTEEQVNPFSLNTGNDNDEQTFNYSFGKEIAEDTNKNDLDQMIIFSDRITFDARNNLGGDFTVSANNNINFGARNNFTLNNSGYSVINSNNIYLGVESKQKTEPIVLGEQLRLLLEKIVNILSGAHALVQGVPLPLVDSTGAPLRLASATVNSINSLQEILEELTIREQNEDGVPQDGNTGFLSKHHFIETNRS